MLGHGLEGSGGANKSVLGIPCPFGPLFSNVIQDILARQRRNCARTLDLIDVPHEIIHRFVMTGTAIVSFTEFLGDILRIDIQRKDMRGVL